ncbi:MAG: lysophospholipid acyltransferase family protein [Candidatus Krumholzibacteria bacterium]|nr:lysophospholipid acyltransferase family protein [Candidatus Krumholzibacteria bacterium]
MKKRIRRWAALLLVRSFIFWTRVLPRRMGLKLFAHLGGVAFALYRKDRERALRNLALAFPQSDPMIHAAMAKGCFRALGRNAFDALRLSYLSKERILALCTVEGEDHLRKARDAGRGVIALTGHIGCWELLAAYFSCKGYKVSVIYRDIKDKKLDSLLVGVRRRHGIASIPRGASAVSAFKVLKRGEILALLIDQDIDVDGIFVPFFGVPAHTPRGAAAFALRSGAPIVPLAIHMQPGGNHHITVLPALEAPPESLGENERIDELTKRCALAVEKLVRIYPQQWVWFHDRWRKWLGDGCGAAAREPLLERESRGEGSWV